MFSVAFSLCDLCEDEEGIKKKLDFCVALGYYVTCLLLEVSDKDE